MLLDENLFEAVNAVGAHRPDTYKKRVKPLSIKVYDDLTNLGYDVHASFEKYGYEISKRNPENLKKARDYLDKAKVPYEEKKYGTRTYLTILIPKEGSAVDDYFRSTDRLMVANEGLEEDASKVSESEMLAYLREYPTYKGRYTRPCKVWDLMLSPEQEAVFGDYLENGMDHFWAAHEDETDEIYQEGRSGGHLVFEHNMNLDDNIIGQDTIIDAFKEYIYTITGLDISEVNSSELRDYKRTFIEDLTDDYNALVNFDKTVDTLIDDLKVELDYIISERDGNGGIKESIEGDKLAQDNINSKNDNFEKNKEALRQSTVELAKNSVDATDNLKESAIERPYTDKLMAALKEGKISYEKVATAALAYLTEDQIKDMCESKLLEALKESLDEHTGSITRNTGLASILNGLITDEWEAIQGYNDAIVNFQTEGNDDGVKVLSDILNEENVHVGQLTTLLKQVDGSAEQIKTGEEEAKEQITSEHIPVTVEVNKEPEIAVVTEVPVV